MLVPAWQQQFRISNCSKNLHTNFTKHLIFLGEGKGERGEGKGEEAGEGYAGPRFVSNLIGLKGSPVNSSYHKFPMTLANWPVLVDIITIATSFLPSLLRQRGGGGGGGGVHQSVSRTMATRYVGSFSTYILFATLPLLQYIIMKKKEDC